MATIKPHRRCDDKAQHLHAGTPARIAERVATAKNQAKRRGKITHCYCAPVVMHSHDQAAIIALDIGCYAVASHEAGITVRRLIRHILIEFC